MIRKGDLIMANKKDYTIEELRKMYADSLKESKTIGEMLRQKEKDEEDRKKAQLALEKETRKKEVDEALENFRNLVNAYIKDYGTYDTASLIRNFPWSWF
jgi:antirestriction protein